MKTQSIYLELIFKSVKIYRTENSWGYRLSERGWDEGVILAHIY